MTSLSTANSLDRERGLELLRTSDYLFAGPGSPTYALREWANTDVPNIISNKLDQGGIVVFASAAALTIGACTVPVYEIYKCGHDPYWLDGLNILGAIGVHAVVIPHYDNAEGGHHDTRFCYLGERRLRLMEQELPADHYVLGVDEHTGVILNLEEGSAEVVGNGTLTIRIDGQSRTFPSGTTLDLAFLVTPDGDTASPAPTQTLRLHQLNPLLMTPHQIRHLGTPPNDALQISILRSTAVMPIKHFVQFSNSKRRLLPGRPTLSKATTQTGHERHYVR